MGDTGNFVLGTSGLHAVFAQGLDAAHMIESGRVACDNHARSPDCCVRHAMQRCAGNPVIAMQV